MAEGFERNVYAVKEISELNEKDVNVRVIGRVIKKDEKSSSIVIDNGKSPLIVLLPSDELFQKTVVGKQVRVFGTVLPYEGGVELKADFVQDFEAVKKDLYTKIYNNVSWQEPRQQPS